MNPTTCKACGLPIFHGPAGYAGPQCMCRWTSAAPRQPEGEGLEVVATVQGDSVSRHLKWNPTASAFKHEIGAELVAGLEAQRAIAELREQVIKAAEQAVRGTEILAILQAERDTLRQQLAEEREHYTFATEKLFAAEAQRDKLAGLLQKARWYVASARYSDNDEGDFAARRQAVMLTDIDAALAEVNK